MDISKSYDLKWCDNCINCKHCTLCENCENCEYCIYCTELKNRRFMIHNKPVSLEEFDKFCKERDNLLDKFALRF